jgi:GTPase SAR1 family protein
LFVASLADYDLTCYEDDITNRMNESLDLFEEIVNGNWFKDTPIILFFNKLDIFKSKIEQIDLKVCFEDYSGGLNFEAAIKFIEQKFLSLNRFDQSRIKILHTCAVNKTDVEKIFDEVTSIVLDNLYVSKTL